MKAMRTALFLLLAMPALAAPRLLLDENDIARIRKTVAAEPWAKAIADHLIRQSDEWPAQHVREYGLSKFEIPKEGAGWSHDYVCPVHGMRLKQSAGKNLCPVDGKDYHGCRWTTSSTCSAMATSRRRYATWGSRIS